MTCDEFLVTLKARNAILAPGATTNNISLINTALQQRRHAMIPTFMQELYTRTNSINLGNGYIFGPTETDRGPIYPIPSILQFNEKLSQNPNLIGKTVFGRNDLFWFAFDAFGTCYMLDNLTLQPLRRYDNPYQALNDCLIAGKL